MNFKSQWNDSIRLAQTLSLPKIWNWLKVSSSFLLSAWTGRKIHWGQPVSLSIEPTTACNLKCPECPSGLRAFSRATGNLKSDFFRKVIGETSNALINLTFYFQGEPYINPQFLDMVAHAKQHKIYTTTSTNGHFLTKANCIKTIEAGLDRLIISIDGATQETYEKYRIAGQLATVLEGTKTLIDTKRKMKAHHPYIIFQCLVVRPNEHELEEIEAIAKSLGVDEVKFKTAQLYDYKNGHELMPTREKFSRYQLGSNGQYEVKGRLKNECWKLWHSGVITWDGQLVPCCFDKDAQHPFGNVREQSFNEVWHGKKANLFRNGIMKGRMEIDICTNCTEGCKIWSN